MIYNLSICFNLFPSWWEPLWWDSLFSQKILSRIYTTLHICIYIYIYRGYIQIFPHHPWIPKWVEGILAAVAVPYRGRLPPSRCPARFPAKSASLSRSKIVVQGLLRGCEILWEKKAMNLLINPKDIIIFFRFFLNPFWRRCFWTCGKGCVFESWGLVFAVGSSMASWVNHLAKWVHPMRSSGSCLNRQLPRLIWKN